MVVTTRSMGAAGNGQGRQGVDARNSQALSPPASQPSPSESEEDEDEDDEEEEEEDSDSESSDSE